MHMRTYIYACSNRTKPVEKPLSDTFIEIIPGGIAQVPKSSQPSEAFGKFSELLVHVLNQNNQQGITSSDYEAYKVLLNS